MRGGPLRSKKWLNDKRERGNMLNCLKSLSSPFTDAVEVKEYLVEPTLSTKVKQQRLSWRFSLPEKELLCFLKLRIKTAVEFGEVYRKKLEY